MAETRTLTVPLSEILSLISCAEDYGFKDAVLFDAFADMVGDLSDDEIEAEAQALLEDDRYEEEDAENVRTALREFRSQYLPRPRPVLPESVE
jgi:hypothetical protein